MYKSTGDGWQHHGSSGRTKPEFSFDSSDLDRYSQARGWGESRHSSIAGRGDFGRQIWQQLPMALFDVSIRLDPSVGKRGWNNSPFSCAFA